MDYISQNGGYIHDAVTTQIWSGKAAVHVSVINWSKQKPEYFYLDNELVNIISPSLRSTVNCSDSIRLKSNLNKGFVGIQPNGRGFYINESISLKWIKLDQRNADVLKKSSSATDLADSPNGIPNRWIIDFKDMPLEDITDYKLPFEHIKKTVKPERDNNRELVLREKWWRFKRTNEALRSELERCNSYFIIPRHSKWFIFMKADKSWLPADSTTAIASDDFYVLGILTSNVHRTWVKAQSSTLKADTRYTHNTCFETFPFPQNPIGKQIEAIRKTAIDLHDYRSAQMEKKQWGITKLYNEYFNEPASQLAKLHKILDDLVLKAYGFSKTDDLLEKLLTLNLEVAEKEKNGESVIGPWAPDNVPEAS